MVLPDTGDELIDKWEAELAQGLEPDLEEGMTAKARALSKEEKRKALTKKLYGKVLGGGFDDSYTPDSPLVLGSPVKKKDNTQSQLLEYAKTGGLSSLDSATLKRMLDSLSPEQATQILEVLKHN